MKIQTVLTILLLALTLPLQAQEDSTEVKAVIEIDIETQLNDDDERKTEDSPVAEEQIAEDWLEQPEEFPCYPNHKKTKEDRSLMAYHEYINQEINRDTTLKEKHGRAMISFIIGMLGNTEEISVKNIEGLDTEELQAIENIVKNNPTFRPGYQNKKVVRTKIEFPIALPIEK